MLFVVEDAPWAMADGSCCRNLARAAAARAPAPDREFGTREADMASDYPKASSDLRSAKGGVFRAHWVRRRRREFVREAAEGIWNECGTARALKASLTDAQRFLMTELGAR